MSSSVIDRAFTAAGVDRWLAKRLADDLSQSDNDAMEARLPELDLLVIGALADCLRRAECGDVVRIHLRRPPRATGPSLPPFDPTIGGVAYARNVARARILAPKGAPIAIDAEEVGLQIAQVALAFGATELIAPMRRMPMVTDGETLDAGALAVLRERELAALIIAAGRSPRVVDAAGERAVDNSTVAKKRFRAPGRDVPHRAEEGDLG
jgi:hypothetical protein